jgi:hypothetical protein
LNHAQFLHSVLWSRLVAERISSQHVFAARYYRAIRGRAMRIVSSLPVDHFLFERLTRRDLINILTGNALRYSIAASPVFWISNQFVPAGFQEPVSLGTPS